MRQCDNQCKLFNSSRFVDIALIRQSGCLFWQQNWLTRISHLTERINQQWAGRRTRKVTHLNPDLSLKAWVRGFVSMATQQYSQQSASSFSHLLLNHDNTIAVIIETTYLPTLQLARFNTMRTFTFLNKYLFSGWTSRLCSSETHYFLSHSIAS